MNSEEIKYCFDANILIFFQRSYPFKFCPDLWSKLDDLFVKGKIISHEIVFNEIYHNKKSPDELAKWILPKRKWFLSTTQRQHKLMPDILKNFPKLIDPNSGKEQADPWLVAMLIEKMESKGFFSGNDDFILVSNEKKNSDINLPAACRYYKIKCIDGFEFFELNKWKLTIL